MDDGDADGGATGAGGGAAAGGAGGDDAGDDDAVHDILLKGRNDPRNGLCHWNLESHFL